VDPFLYQYSIGGIVFGAGLFFGFRQGALGFEGKALRNLLAMLLGLAFFMGLQGWLQYSDMVVADAKPYTGSGLPDGVKGQPIDYAIMVAYFVAMLVIGTWFGRGQQTTKDFFFGGQRFSWWLISFSLIATTIGSYSFVKYSKVAFNYGIASSQTYLNDWFWMPLMLFGWLPILYFTRLVSIPEYFERRFGSRERRVATWLLLVYLIGYVGINLFTMGQALNILLGWPVLLCAGVVAAISAVYVTSGGQTSVIMTDLFQGAMLLVTGMLLLWLGIDYMGGLDNFWSNLPRGHRTAFTNFNTDPDYHSVGLFWQDGMANTAMFFFLNQGMAMRLLSARSLKDSRRAVIVTSIVLMPIAAMVVASGGWVAKALVHGGMLPPDIQAKEAFFIAADFLSRPGVFGLIMAALTAALMSTVDTLITAVAAIYVNDIYKPKHPTAGEPELLRAARLSSVSVTVFGVALVPLFMGFDSIYSAHGAFTAAVTPPMVVALMLGVFWRRFSATAAFLTMVGGSIVIAASVVWPEMITPFAHGVPMKEVEDSFLAGKNQYKFMRAFFGLVVCTVIGVVSGFATKGRPLEEIRGLVWGTVGDAIRMFYGGRRGADDESEWLDASLVAAETEQIDENIQLPLIRVSGGLAKAADAQPGDILYVTDCRWWLGGLRSGHGRIQSIDEADTAHTVHLGPTMRQRIIVSGRDSMPLKVKRLH
jgi:SSS family solute:Na+ symporter